MKTILIIILTSFVVIIAVAALNFTSYSDKSENQKPNSTK
jgi:hypothetical protein